MAYAWHTARSGGWRWELREVRSQDADAKMPFVFPIRTTFIHQHMVQQRDQGCAVLLVSADLDEILLLSDRIAVMYQGKILVVVEAHAVSRETLGWLMAGLAEA